MFCKGAMFLELIFIFIYKLLDVALSTLKNVLLFRKRYVAYGISYALSQLVFLLIIKQMSSDSGYAAIVTVTVASFIGAYLPTAMSEVMSKDKIYVYDITAPLEEGKIFADKLKELNIPITTHIGYKNLEKVLCVRAYSRNKQESKIIINEMNDDFKYVFLETNIFAD